MIAQVVFDLPIDGPFDYLIPSHLADRITVGMRLAVPFGPRIKTGFVVKIINKSVFEKLKTIPSLDEGRGAFSALDLDFARQFCATYGCSLGEALSVIDRARGNLGPSIHREGKPKISLYQCRVNRYPSRIIEILNGYSSHARFLILVPDVFRAQFLSQQLKDERIVKIGARSCVFECDGRYDCVIMVDDENASYKQEQMPMYQTREALLMRSKIYGFDVAFVGTSPSVELVSLSRAGDMAFIQETGGQGPAITTVDLSLYKFLPGLVSPPLNDGIQAALKAGKKCLLILNRRGSYRFTSCQNCGYVLKCSRCDTPLTFSRLAGKYLCGHCSYTQETQTVCPQCQYARWRSSGMGVEQIQRELKKYFPQARIISFERSKQSKVTGQSLGDFDILISTQAFLRFGGLWQMPMTAFIDFDMELNRLNMRSSFGAFSLGLHTRDMTSERMFIQTRQPNHYVLESLKTHDAQKFYDEELKVRKELGFSPFKHWIMITLRSKSQKTAQESAQQVYNQLHTVIKDPDNVMAPAADFITRRREKFIFNVMVQTQNVLQTMALIKSALCLVRPKAMVAINGDP